jgi:ABC-2 type transport system permease protein
MKRLFRIELIKISSNASFWVLTSLHIGIILLIVLSGQFFLKTISIDGKSITNLIDPKLIPLYQFPDIWHNVTYVAGYLKFILALYIIISVTNEISYNTLRQNIMNGLGRVDFIISKFLLVILLACCSALFVFITTLILGFINTPNAEMSEIIKYSGFVPAYLLMLTSYLIFSVFIGLLIKRTGLAMGLLFLYTLIIEPVIVFRIEADWIKGLFPIKAINSLIHMPFGKYILREVQDFVSLREVLIVVIYSAIFTWLIYLLLKKRDL